MRLTGKHVLNQQKGVLHYAWFYVTWYDGCKTLHVEYQGYEWETHLDQFTINGQVTVKEGNDVHVYRI